MPIVISWCEYEYEGCIENKLNDPAPYEPASLIPDQVGQMGACICQ